MLYVNFAQFIVKFLYTREIEFSHINHFNCIPVVLVFVA